MINAVARLDKATNIQSKPVVAEDIGGLKLVMNMCISKQHEGGSGGMLHQRKLFLELEALRLLLRPFLDNSGLRSDDTDSAVIVPYSTTDEGYQRTTMINTITL